MLNGYGRNRTCDVSVVGDLQSLALAARHTYPYNPALFLLAPCRNKLFVGVLLP